MRRLSGFLLLAVMLFTAGCYHATINTGRQPNGQTIVRPWAHAFLGGLVPPSVTETASQCPGGVAVVETQLSFLNMVANAITLGIYSPMTITVQCAGGAPVPDDAIQASSENAAGAISAAVQRSARTGEPVWVAIQ